MTTIIAVASFFVLVQSAVGCIVGNGELSSELQQGNAFWQSLVIPKEVSYIPFQMWTRRRYTALNYSYTTVIGNSNVVSKIQMSFPYGKNLLTTGEIPYIGNKAVEEAINSTGFLISFICASNGYTPTTLKFVITGRDQLGSRTCKTEGEFSIKKSCLGLFPDVNTDSTYGSTGISNSTDSSTTTFLTESLPSALSPSPTAGIADEATSFTSSTTSGTHPSSTGLSMIWAICISVAVIVVLLVAITTGVLVHRKRKKERQRQNQRQNQRLASAATVQSALSMQELWEINPGNVRLDNQIGKGAFSIVYRGAYYSERDDSSTVVAVKCLRADSQTSEKEMLLKEIELLKDMEQHRNLLTMKGCCTVSPDTPIMLIMEYMNMGNLLNYLRENRFLKCDREECEERLSNPNILSCIHNEKVKEFLDECLVITYQVSRGMEWMEKQHYVHRDLAARNVLLHALDDKRIIAKISDFGLARNVYESEMVRESADEQKPTKWTAPEGLLDDIFTIKSDVWSFGVVLWEVASFGSVPYPGLEKQVLVSMLEKGHRMNKPEDCNDELYLLMVRCWQSSPDKRPRFEEIRAKLEEMVTTTRGYTDLGNTKNITSGDSPETFGESAYCDFYRLN